MEAEESHPVLQIVETDLQLTEIVVNAPRRAEQANPENEPLDDPRS